MHRLATPLLGLTTLGWLAGCSSPDAQFPYSNLKLNQVCQAPGGQLALIYDTAQTRPPGQRAFLVDETVLAHNIASALEDIKENQGHAEAFSGGLILHRNHSLTDPGRETFWVELDPFALTGKWLPPLDQPPLPLGAVITALPGAFNPPLTKVSGNENFLWQTAEGPFDTTVSRQALFQPNRRDTLVGKTEAVLGGTTIVAGCAALLGTVIAVECLSHGDYDLSYPYYPTPSSYPSHPYRY